MRRILGLLVALASIFMAVAVDDSPASASSCRVIGKTRVTKGTKYICTQRGRSRVWVRASSASNRSEAASSIRTTTTTSSATQELFRAPTTPSDNIGVCELQDRSVHRINYPKGPYVGFPRRPINSFPNSGVITYALIPLDWSDLRGEEGRLEEAVEQTKQFKAWMESASQGQVRINWRIHRSWIRMPGASSRWFTPRAWPANVDFGDAALATADPEFDFSNVDAVIFYLPSLQEVFLEGSQGTVDSGLDRPFRTTEGLIPAFSVIGKYFDQPHKTNWSAWVHYTLIWMGMPQLLDARSNRNAAPRDIPIGDMSGWDIMSTQDGPNRQLSGWLRLLLNWIETDQVYCKALANIDKIQLSLIPVGEASSKLKFVGVRISDTKLVGIESRRLDKRFDCEGQGSIKTEGVIVYIVNTERGHTDGDTMSLVPPRGRSLRRDSCWSPPLVDPVMTAEEFVDVLGVRIKVLATNRYDFIEITRP